MAVLFGFTVDFAMACLSGLTVQAYWAKWLCSGAGAVLIGFGIALEILSDSIPAPADSTTRAISQVTGIQFGKVKTGFDCAQVLTAVLIALLFMRKIVAIREGTVFLAICTGSVIQFFMKRLAFVRKLTEDKKNTAPERQP